MVLEMILSKRAEKSMGKKASAEDLYMWGAGGGIAGCAAGLGLAAWKKFSTPAKINTMLLGGLLGFGTGLYGKVLFDRYA